MGLESPDQTVGCGQWPSVLDAGKRLLKEAAEDLKRRPEERRWWTTACPAHHSSDEESNQRWRVLSEVGRSFQDVQDDFDRYLDQIASPNPNPQAGGLPVDPNGAVLGFDLDYPLAEASAGYKIASVEITKCLRRVLLTK
ncbi:hypothetical protein R1sor_011349 [Riccia sorocarpa]|uniref:Uncharacterized protein n=1 Tax=Riccia sorocarpa TaxID=122646 RepID=A0ABD3I0M9_9MARC